MTSLSSNLLALTLLTVAALPSAALQDGDGPPPLDLARLPAGLELLHVQPFLLDAPAVHTWRAEQPGFDAGLLLVLEANDRSLIWVRQLAMPVLYVGRQTAERVNTGHVSGKLVVIVPGARDGQGGIDIDLTAAPIFLGDPGLPEEVDAAQIDAQVAAAEAAGLQPPTAEQVAAVSRPLVRFPDAGELEAYSAVLVQRHAPDEVDLIEGLRAPRLTR